VSENQIKQHKAFAMGEKSSPGHGEFSGGKGGTGDTRDKLSHGGHVAGEHHRGVPGHGSHGHEHMEESTKGHHHGHEHERKHGRKG